MQCSKQNAGTRSPVFLFEHAIPIEQKRFFGRPQQRANIGDDMIRLRHSEFRVQSVWIEEYPVDIRFGRVERELLCTSSYGLPVGRQADFGIALNLVTDIEQRRDHCCGTNDLRNARPI